MEMGLKISLTECGITFNDKMLAAKLPPNCMLWFFFAEISVIVHFNEGLHFGEIYCFCWVGFFEGIQEFKYKQGNSLDLNVYNKYTVII